MVKDLRLETQNLTDQGVGAEGSGDRRIGKAFTRKVRCTTSEHSHCRRLESLVATWGGVAYIAHELVENGDDRHIAGEDYSQLGIKEERTRQQVGDMRALTKAAVEEDIGNGSLAGRRKTVISTTSIRTHVKPYTDDGMDSWACAARAAETANTVLKSILSLSQRCG